MTDTLSNIRPRAIAQFDDGGTTRWLPITERELARADSFYRRLLSSDWNLRDRFALIIGTQGDAAWLSPLETALQERGMTITNSEANAWDGARTEATIRRFDVAIVAIVTKVVLEAIRNAGHDPVTLFQDKIVWAEGEAYEELKDAQGIDLRRWVQLGPAWAMEGRHRGGCHYDAREWTIVSEGDVLYISSRLDRGLAFDRFAVPIKAQIHKDPVPGGSLGPRLVL